MALTRDDIVFAGREPRIPASYPVTRFAAPCLADSERSTRVLADVLGIEVATTVALPTGVAAVGKAGQIEHFAASGGVRARNVERLTAFEDEKRDWADLKEERTREGVRFSLGEETAARLTRLADAVLDKAGLASDGASSRIVLEQWAQFDERGKEVAAGVGRATVAVTYEVAGVPMLGAGAKSNLHFDPEGAGGALARFFHVNRRSDEVGEVRTAPFELALDGLLEESWTSRELSPGDAKIEIQSATTGLLALPAHVPQSHALPVLSVEGVVHGDFGGLDQLHFARYLPLFDAKDAARRGFAPGVDPAIGLYEPDKARTQPRRQVA
ncbi:hypothetical protein [Microbacterium sp. C7(2022)]|uniref:hypothetical protein n=1 Tax=Microbacterium sp. C7(2022) TaxID=2992759 RepID=UPI00237C07F7|nr:hypothetical protein [Microbacterium sp. C7(2022)]MDE0546577.1 hypothetical protein [Microbacterium sp. C7(2022)]